MAPRDRCSYSYCGLTSPLRYFCLERNLPRATRSSWERVPVGAGRFLALRRDQADTSDFGRNPKAVRRTPVARAAADVHPQIPQPMQPRGEGLKEANE